jgi:hypothetical protein
MVGLIWFVQLVHYPLFAAVGPDHFVGYEAGHTQRTTWVVAIFMPIELATAVWIAAVPPAGVPAWLAWTGAGLAVGLWMVTVLVQVPLHRRLGLGFDAAVWRSLVSRNWVRTAAWSARGLIAMTMLAA